LWAKINKQGEVGIKEQEEVKRGPWKGLWKREGRRRSGEGRLEVIESPLEVRFVEHLFSLHHTEQERNATEIVDLTRPRNASESGPDPEADGHNTDQPQS
ncbi:MAG: hypothetical protein GY792_14935, partial [Gammaproteobacteria bacterium]|nr:hypothetical protein [Gammaproteobacteria bacterium]